MKAIEVFCRSVKGAREQRQISQAEVADLLGMSQPAYHKIENGRTDISLMNALVLAKFFGLKLDNLPIRFKVDIAEEK